MSSGPTNGAVVDAARDVVSSLSPAVRRRLLHGRHVGTTLEAPVKVPAHDMRALIEAVEGTSS